MLGTLEKTVPARGKISAELLKEYLETAAYYQWQARGCPWGDPLSDWLAAEEECLYQEEGERRERRSRKRKPEPFLARVFEQS